MSYYIKAQFKLVKGRRPFRSASTVVAKVQATTVRARGLLTRCILYGALHPYGRMNPPGIDDIRRAYSSDASDDKKANRDQGSQPKGKDRPLFSRMRDAWTNTPIKWYPLPVAVGAIVLVVVNYRKKLRKEVQIDEHGQEVIKLKGPWQVHVLGALPLRNLSRLWGYLNSLELPIWFRPIGFRAYAYIFGCNLDEIEYSDLREYKSLGDFFYRRLKDGVRPIDAAILVSPADGTVLHFGTIQDLRVEQVKGITYSLDAFLGVEKQNHPVGPTTPSTVAPPPGRDLEHPDMSLVDHREFADINGIEYSLNQLIGDPKSPSSSGASTPTTEHEKGSSSSSPAAKRAGEQTDASVEPDKGMQEVLAEHTSVAREMGIRPSLDRRRSTSGTSVKEGNSLFFSVIYLAPGDYHRFHSPTAWVVEKRRHFVGELFSVSPYMAKRLENLFVLNERVALLGRWRHGFFALVPVGATNVGSIKINFDQDLRTNMRGRPPPAGTYHEAVYSAASPTLNGQPLNFGQEMGGFCLGSTVVLIFEAPKDFEFAVSPGQHVKVGQKLGDIVDRSTP